MKNDPRDIRWNTSLGEPVILLGCYENPVTHRLICHVEHAEDTMTEIRGTGITSYCSPSELIAYGNLTEAILGD